MSSEFVQWLNKFYVQLHPGGARPVCNNHFYSSIMRKTALFVKRIFLVCWTALFMLSRHCSAIMKELLMNYYEIPKNIGQTNTVTLLLIAV
ncbi:hypothetical protein [Paenibacillus alvei]|uniref:hypothetical protein n=1 Tax=Paenibacillus alvei TaxID=44250 RepID=UPI0013DAF6E6|nr:hypothetical protein [Paenibacillus alvei]